MFPRMFRANPPTTLAAIEDFERSRGLTLPGLYKQFLLAANGGRPDNPVFPIEGMALNPAGAVHEFFGVGVQRPLTDLVEIFDWFSKGIPSGIVPIARTDGSDYVCLDLRNGRDRVVFWDNRPFWGTGVWREEDLYHVANSFEEFLSALHPNRY